MNKQRLTGFSLGCWVFALWAGAVPPETARAGEPASLTDWNVSGEWKITLPDGTVNVYTIDRHGRMQGTLNGTKVSGHAIRHNDKFTYLTIAGSDILERLWTDNANQVFLMHFDHKADFPSKNARPIIAGVRQQPMPPSWASEPDVSIADLAGQWTVVYGNTAVHTYVFDKDGKMGGRYRDGPNDVALSGQIMLVDGRLLLNHYGSLPGQIPPMERLTLRVDGRLSVEHWNPRAGFYAGNKPDTGGLGVPVTGKPASGVETLDALMLQCLEKIGCSGATLTVARGGHTYYSRGYGWSDFEHTVQIEPDTPMGIGSCAKPLIAAMVRQLAAQKGMPMNFTVLPFFQVKPAGEVVDKRVWDITAENLIDHKAGWQGDPITKAWQAYNGQKFPIVVEDMLPYVAVQRLAFTPGTKDVYDNFGYGVLSRIATRLAGKNCIEYLRDQLCRPFGVQELKWVRDGGPRRKGEPKQLWNGLILEDLKEYRGCVSMPALCTFMRYFWIDGTPRADHKGETETKDGSWDNSSTLMIWRPDGINVAWSFNGRTGVDDGPGEALWKNAVDSLIADKNIPAK